MINKLYSVVSLQSFVVFPEYFLALSIIYLLIVITLIVYNSDGLMLQKAISECLAVVFLMTCYLMLNDDISADAWYLSFNKAFIHDNLAFFTKFTLCFFSAVYFLLISNSLKEQKLTSFEYLIILSFSILGLLLMCSSTDLLVTYLAIELSSLALYVLAAFKKTSSYSVESGIKYFVTGAVSSAFFLLGCSFLYGISGSVNFHDFHLLFDQTLLYSYPNPGFIEGHGSGDKYFDIYVALRQGIYYYFLTAYGFFDSSPKFDYSNVVELGLTLILFSLFIKLALAPFHLWSLDVYEGSPTSSTIFFAVFTKLSVLVLILRLCYMCFESLKDWWQFHILFVGVFSVFVGAFGGLKQRKLKTLLAYSSTSHMGYILMTIGGPDFYGLQVVLFYMIIYMISSLCVWSVLLFLRLKRKNSMAKYNKELGDLVLLRKSNNSLALALLLTMFSIAGIPPLVGFLAKLGVFLHVIKHYLYLAALAGILFSVVSTFYYIRLVKVLYFENMLVGKLYYPIDSEKTILISFLVFSLVFLFLSPTLLHLVCYKVVLHMFV